MDGLNPIVQLVEMMVSLLLVAALTLAFCKNFKLPFTVILVIVGIAIAHLSRIGVPYLDIVQHIEIAPELILYVCLPTLLFESALYLDVKELRENLPAVLTLAIPGLFLSTMVIGAIIYWCTPLSFLICVLIGAILSATDPVAVISLFKEIGASKRLTVLVEGESLLNDATAIVLAKIILLVMLTGSLTTGTVLHGVYDFFFEFFGGIAIGLVVSIILAFLLGFVKEDPYIEISLVTVIAYLSFFLGDHVFHVSGVMATMMAGIIMGGWGYTKISPQVAKYLKQFLEFIVFVANAVIFFIVGLSTNLNALMDNWLVVLIVIFAMLVSRAVVVGSFIPLLNRLSNAPPVNFKYQTVMWWGGLRGAIALAIVLSLQEIPEKEIISAVVIGSVIFTLLFQGLSIKKIVCWLGLNVPTVNDRMAKLETELAAEVKATKQIPKLQKGGLFSLNIANALTTEHEHSIFSLKNSLQTLQCQELTEQQQTQLLYLRCCSLEKSLFYDLFSQGHFTEDVYHDLIYTLNSHLDILRHHKNPIEKLAEYEYKERFFKRLHRIFSKVNFLGQFAEYFRARQLALEYETNWAYQQGSFAVKEYLNSDELKANMPDTIRQKVFQRYQQLNDHVRKKLDNIAEQFPEFVAAMQTQLGKRLILHTEYQLIQEHAHAGLIQEGVAEQMGTHIKHMIYDLQKPKLETLTLDPHEIIRKVPFFAKLSTEQAKKIVPLLTSYTALADEVIVEQGVSGDSLFLIARGVVRVIVQTKEGATKELATLMAGDFFGEMALLHEIKRTATCKAITPCALYQLKRHVFEHICSEYHDIGDTIREIDRQRRLAMNK
jgi:monovalent cation:H+ antiporter, CPA1 family